jgi:hypothetical protein
VQAVRERENKAKEQQQEGVKQEEKELAKANA